MKKVNLTTQIIVMTVLGIIFGALFGQSLSFLDVIGKIFLRLIQMSIVILIMGQIIEAVGNLNPRGLGKIGLKTFGLFISSSLIAAIIGITAGVAFNPGSGVDTSLLDVSGEAIETVSTGSIPELILDFFPTNIFSSMTEGSIVQVIVFSLIFGIALSFVKTEQEDNLILEWVKQFNAVILKMIGLIMKTAPIGIFAIIASTISKMGLSIILPMGKYLAVYGFATILYLVVWFAITSIYLRVSIIKLSKNMLQMSLMALTTTSSAITLPTALNDSKEKLGVSDRIAKLVLPLGMSLNSNGSSMHMAITIVTIAQIYGVTYGMSDFVYIVILSTMASLANAVVPGAGLVSLTIVIPSMGLPIESIALFAGVDWFVGMLRTILNVDSDTTTALIVAKSENELDYDIFNR
ncbi:dicarboxylate/amino acid:cation symporter [Carnobacterium sp. ISL-102]|uniref:dicarboxylate/amino acid:cation symporter n=1 Tax=Carnobacterium sp. ISL-102 TaxID=2819142 RepID=UPI0020352A8E|nr:dicarboxylate/amino acid:cation symporter [Carnobacterium sp. ISL-102]